MNQAIRWNQHSIPADPRFLIVDVDNHTLKQCRVDGVKGKTVQWRELSRNNQIPRPRAFDWHFTHNVVAIGQWSGKVLVQGLENDSASLTVAAGGERSCNSVAFNPDSLLAVGLDRNRSAYALNIHDIRQWTNSTRNHDHQLHQQTNEPIRKFALAETVVSIKFFGQQPSVLAVGVRGVGLRIYDTRTDSSTPVSQYSTMCVHNIAVDPCNANYFAAAAAAGSKDATVQIWDRRSAARQLSSAIGQNPAADSPLLELRDIFKTGDGTGASSIWSLRYSIAEPGSLGVLGNHGAIRIFDTKRDWIDVDEDSRVNVEDLVSPISVVHSKYIGVTNHVDPRTGIGSTTGDRVLAFDFINMLSSHARPAAITMYAGQEIQLEQLSGRGTALATNFASKATLALGVSQSESSTGMNVYSAPQTNSISEALLAINKRLLSSDDLIFNTEQLVEDIDDGWAGSSTKPNTPAVSRPASIRSGRRVSRQAPKGSIDDALTIAERARRRCLEGYLFDPQRNAAIVKGNRDLTHVELDCSGQK